MTLEQLKALISDLGYDDVKIFDDSLGFDYADAFIGMSSDERAVYSYDKMIEHIMLKEGWPYEEAVEWIDFNTIRALPYGGPKGPIVVYDVPEYMLEDYEPETEMAEKKTVIVNKDQIMNTVMKNDFLHNEVDIEKYKTDDGKYDCSSVTDKELESIYRQLSDEDNIVVIQENDTPELDSGKDNGETV